MDVRATLRQGIAAHRSGDVSAAEAAYREAAREGSRDAAHNLGVLYRMAGRLEEAEAVLRQVIATWPEADDSRHTLGMVLLGQGRYAEGWPLYEKRLTTPPFAFLWRLPMPQWQGEPLDGRRLVVLGEQGFGDQLMFGRFLPRLPPQTVTYVSPVLAGLLANTTTYPGGRPDGDAWVSMGSLPGLLNVTLETLQGGAYIAPPVGVRSGGGVGVVTKGRATHVNDTNRSLHGEDAAALLALGRDLSPEATGATSFLETAAIVAELDLVISVDSAIAHLAGAMGKPVWLLLPAWDTDWRWLRTRSDSPWYDSARLFRQPEVGHWEPVLEEIRRAL